MADTLTQLAIITKIFSNYCVNVEDSLWTGFFEGLNFWPFILGLILLGMIFIHTELFYAAFAWAFWIEFLINWGIRAAFNQPGPDTKCSSSIQMPAYATDGLVFTTMFLMISSAVSFDFSLRWYKILLLGFFGPLTLYSRVWLHYNTPQQLLAGALAGSIAAAIWIIIVDYTLKKWYKSILFKTFLGTDYIDTLINPHRPTMCYTNLPMEIRSKIKDEEVLQGVMEERTERDNIRYDFKYGDIEYDEGARITSDEDYVNYISNRQLVPKITWITASMYE